MLADDLNFSPATDNIYPVFSMWQELIPSPAISWSLVLPTWGDTVWIWHHSRIWHVRRRFRWLAHTRVLLIAVAVCGIPGLRNHCVLKERWKTWVNLKRQVKFWSFWPSRQRMELPSGHENVDDQSFICLSALDLNSLISAEVYVANLLANN